MMTGAAALGIPEDKLEALNAAPPPDDECPVTARGDYDVWNENWDAVMLFIGAADCWSFAGMAAQPTGFDVVRARAVWDAAGVKFKPATFGKVRMIAAAALDEMLKKLAADAKRGRHE